jgi:hypothetical protein
MWEHPGEWMPTNNLRFVDGTLQQLWRRSVKFTDGRWCFAKVVTHEQAEWRAVESFVAEEARYRDLHKMGQ